MSSYKGIKPIHGRVLVRADKADEYYGKIYIPETARDGGRKKLKALFGEVVAVATQGEYQRACCHEPIKQYTMELEVGDRVIYSQHSGHPVVAADGEKLLILRESTEVFVSLGKKEEAA